MTSMKEQSCEESMITSFLGKITCSAPKEAGVSAAKQEEKTSKGKESGLHHSTVSVPRHAKLLFQEVHMLALRESHRRGLLPEFALQLLLERVVYIEKVRVAQLPPPQKNKNTKTHQQSTPRLQRIMSPKESKLPHDKEKRSLLNRQRHASSTLIRHSIPTAASAQHQAT